MRILHTSDWHVGRRFCDHDVLDHLALVLDEIVEVVRTESVDVVLIAGDVFDRASPPPEAFRFLDDYLDRIREAGAQIVLISGNHDGASRLSFMSRAAARYGIHVRTVAESIGEPVILHDRHGPVHFYGIPYLDPNLDRNRLGDDQLRTHELILDAAMDRIRSDLAGRGSNARAIVLAHCFAINAVRRARLPAAADTAAVVTGSMRSIAVGGVEVTPSAVFDGVSYVALGHLHTKQSVTPTIRYSGAPLAYSFTDDRGARGFWLVDLDGDGAIDTQWRELPVPRQMSILTGTLSDLLTDPAHEPARTHWVSAVLTDPIRPLDAMRRLRERFAYCAQLEHRQPRALEDTSLSYRERVRGKPDEQVTLDFIEHVRAVAATGAERALVAAAFEDIRRDEAAE